MPTIEPTAEPRPRISPEDLVAAHARAVAIERELARLRSRADAIQARIDAMRERLAAECDAARAVLERSRQAHPASGAKGRSWPGQIRRALRFCGRHLPFSPHWPATLARHARRGHGRLVGHIGSRPGPRATRA